VTDGSG